MSGLVKSYGLFWRRDEVDWRPGSGGKFRLLGRRGSNLPGLRLADFRSQKGIYILYGDYGPHYVGLTRRLGLGKRLDQHRSDHHVTKWDRFSWFGFRTVLSRKDSYGLCMLKDMATFSVGDPNALIADVEALLIRVMGLSHNVKKNYFAIGRDCEWKQVKVYESESYLGRVRPI